MYTRVEATFSQWDDFVSQHPRHHLLQLANWGKVKADYGWTPQQVTLADASGRLVAGAQLLLRPLPYRLGKMIYVPFGPLVDWENAALVKSLIAAIDAVARQHKAVFMKIEPGYDVPKNALESAGFRLSPQTVQPPRTFVLDIQADEETILAAMNQGTRRNIRKSQKNGIQIREGRRADVDQFNRLLDITGRRQGFGVHVASYYERVYELFVQEKTPANAALLMASYFDEATQTQRDLAGVFVFALGQQSWYLYGASSDEERQRMASFGVQWAAIQWAKAHGASAYDMVGIPDFPLETLEAQFEARHDDLWGVYRFKRGWGGEVVRTVGAWDRVYNRPIYWLYRRYMEWRKGTLNA